MIVATDAMIQLGMRRIKTSAFGASNQLFTGEVNSEIIISGSSRALTHYDPQIITQITGRSCFNLGRNGSQTDMQLAYLKAYLAHNTAPKIIIHNLDSFSFLTSKEIYDPAQYFPYLWDRHIYEGVRRVYPKSAWKMRYVPLYAYAIEDLRFTWTVGLRALVGLQPRETLFRGYEERHLTWTGDFSSFRSAHPEGVRFEIEDQGVRDLTELVTLCKERGIQLLLVYSPVYREMQKLEKNADEIHGEFSRIALAGGATLLDFRNSPICDDQSLFYNSQHLNVSGAKRFSQEISEILQSHGTR